MVKLQEFLLGSAVLTLFITHLGYNIKCTHCTVANLVNPEIMDRPFSFTNQLVEEWVGF